MPPIRVLNVAEKPSVAKEVSRVLNGGRQPSFRRGKSQYNANWEFAYTVENRPCHMVFTSVTGHLMEMAFDGATKNWRSCNPCELLEAKPVFKTVGKGKDAVAENLQAEARNAAWLILWLDCDREGENIAFEVIDVCRAAKPSLRILRAQFSALAHGDVTRALRTLREPNANEARAVDVRQEFDLRFGAGFTRFNTLLVQDHDVRLPGGEDGKPTVLSIGPCQFPTLGFIVQRKWDIDAHVPEPFWKIVLVHQPGGRASGGANAPGVGPNVTGAPGSLRAEFEWARGRLFDRALAETLFRQAERAGSATVTREGGRPSYRNPPLPLNTLEMQKRLNRAIRISPEAIMKLAEELYQAGFISYPRTETDSFPPDFDYRETVEALRPHPTFGFHADALAEGGRFELPRRGSNNDNAHPPIYPTKLMSEREYGTLRGKNPNLPKVYDFVCRHFLACCSKPAVAHRSEVEVEMGGEVFKASGTMIKEMNYLNIYGRGPEGGPRLDPSYDGWASTSLPTYAVGETFRPTIFRLDESATQAPPLLSEVDLLQKMDTHGIGTDATQASHIEKVVGERGYAVKVGDNRLRPTELGEALVAGYSRAGLGELWRPEGRARMEADVHAVAQGRMGKEAALKKHTAPMVHAYRGLERNKQTLLAAVREFVVAAGNHAPPRGRDAPYDENGGNGGGGGAGPGPGPGHPPDGECLGTVRRCLSCGCDVELRRSASTGAFEVACVGCLRGASAGARSTRLPDAVVEAAVDVMSDCENPRCAGPPTRDLPGGSKAQIVHLRARRLPPMFAEMRNWTGCVFCDAHFARFVEFYADAPRDAGRAPGTRAAPTAPPDAPRAADADPERVAGGRARGGRGRGGVRGADESGEPAPRRNVRARVAAGGGRGRGRGRGGGGGGRGGGGDACFECGGTGHWASDCPNA